MENPQELLEAAADLLHRLYGLTTEEFRRGLESVEREHLRDVLCYAYGIHVCCEHRGRPQYQPRKGER